MKWTDNYEEYQNAIDNSDYPEYRGKPDEYKASYPDEKEEIKIDEGSMGTYDAARA